MSDKILNSVRQRIGTKSKFGYGITTADTYLKHIQACAGESVCCSNNPWSRQANSPAWPSVMKDAESKLVYSNDETVVKQDTVTTNSSDFKSVLHDKDTVVPAKTIMVFRNIVTTPKKDRDGDVLRTGGAEIDKMMPLLWQHMHVAPIGRMLEVVEHNEKELIVTSAVIDSALGNDTANLVEFGALRISHGFIPKEFKELEKRDGEMPGYDITKFEIMEESVVSVPSNTDAVIEAVSRGKLADPLVKSWAQHYYDNRPLIVTGVDMSNIIESSEKHIQSIEETEDTITVVFGKTDDYESSTEQPEEDGAEPMEDEEVAGEYRATEEDEKAEPDELSEGDFVEWNSSGGKARGKIVEVVVDGEIEVPDSEFVITGTEDDPAALIQVYADDEPTDVMVGHLFSALTKIDPIEPSEEPAEAEDEADENSMEERSHDCGCSKSGKVLSKSNEYKIAHAKELMDEVAAAPDGDVKGKYKAMAERGSKYLKEVLEEAGYHGDKDDEGKAVSLDSVAKTMLQMADEADADLLKRVAFVLNETAEAKERQKEHDELESILNDIV